MLILDWKSLVTEIKSLTEKIDRKPDLVVGIVRGGLIPAQIISHKLGIKAMHCLTVKKLEKSCD
jgi:hypoxanthine phosphoribosyltransferase